MGRPLPAPGEPLFTVEDTAAALALAEEERDTCPACGMPKAFCRAGSTGVAFTDFEPVEETCQATLRLAHHREAVAKDKKRHAVTQQAMQLSVRFRDGRAPQLTAGLDLPGETEQPHRGGQ